MGQILLVYRQGLNGTLELMQTVSSKADEGLQRMRARPQRFSSTKFPRGPVSFPDDAERVATIVIREIEIQAYHSGCFCSGLSMLLSARRDPELRRSRTSQASQLLTSPARRSSSIVERYDGAAILNTLSSHVRRASSNPPFIALHLLRLRPLAQTWVHHTRTMDPDEEAGTAASPNHIIARLRTLEAADQASLWLSTCATVVHRGVGDSSNPTDWQTRCGFHHGGLMPHVRFSHSSESPVDRGICFCRSFHARPTCCPILCWSIWRQFQWCSLHRSSHTLGLKQERLGGWDDRWSDSCVKHAVRDSQRRDHLHRGAGGRAVRTLLMCDRCRFD